MRKITLLFSIALVALFSDQPTRCFAQRPGDLKNRAYKNAVLEKVADFVESKYVLADKAKGFADEFRKKCRSGSYDAITTAQAFAEKVTADLVAITGDKHLNFRVIVPSDVGEKAAGSLHHPVRYFRLRAKENTGFYRLDWIEPRIGYIDLRRFYSFDQAKDMAVAAMTFLANAQAIIIDVRENGGGSGDYLSSYFLPYPTQLSGLYTREDRVLTESWTRRDIGIAPRTDVPIFILTGPDTFSAAEYFAYDMQSRKRATLVGEPTKGGAHDVDLCAIDDQFEFYISTGRAVSPVTGGNWEGVGVIPDIRVPAAAALDAALIEAKKAAETFGRGEDEGLKRAVEEMQALADEAAGLYREGKSQAADAALDTLFKLAREKGLLSEFFVDVFAYNYQSAPDERMLFAILKKETDLFPRSVDARERLASVYASKGNRELALVYYRQVLELDPENRKAMKMIKALDGLPGAVGRREPLRLTFIANAGVLVSSGDKKVLIDGLFDKPNPEYRAPSPDVLAKIMKGEAPYDGVDLVLVTHDHPDHFDARLVARYLETVPGPILLAPADAVAELRKAAADWAKIEPRVVSLDLKVGEKDERELEQIPITAFRTLHGKEESPMNVMFLFELAGWRIFHEGDSPGNVDEYRGFRLGSGPIDLALVHYWFPLEPRCASFLQEVLKPGHIALTHLPVRLEGDAPGKIDQVRRYYRDIFLLLPGMPEKIFASLD
jgi:L-ascorbate metabolism protein UlaG (beta-lactamase superfamily)